MSEFCLETLQTMENTAIDRIRHYCSGKHVTVAFSYGKDSCVIYHLAKLAGIQFDARFRPTSIDPPDLLKWGRKVYPDIIWEPCKESFYHLIERKGTPPGRTVRYCCAELKEKVSTPGGVVILGIRWAESTARKQRKMFEACAKRNEWLLSPIIDWSDSVLWRYIHWRKIEVSPLYAEGWNRVGCIACPMGSEWVRRRDLARWPHVARNLERAFDRMLVAHPRRKIGGDRWNSGRDVLEWWLRDKGRAKPDGGLCKLWSSFDDGVDGEDED